MSSSPPVVWASHWAEDAGNRPQVGPAHPVTLVDTHGAGDAFIGALAARLVDGPRFGKPRASPMPRLPFLSAPRLTRKISYFDRVMRFLSENS